MCMQNVNVTVSLFKSVLVQSDLFPTSFINPISSIVATVKDDKHFIEDFVVVTQTGIIGELEQKISLYSNILESNNVLTRKGSLDVKVVLTLPRLVKELSLDNFAINVAKEKICEEDFYPFVNNLRVIKVPQIELPGVGTYIIKVLTKHSDKPDDEYQHQAMHKLRVISPLN